MNNIKEIIKDTDKRTFTKVAVRIMLFIGVINAFIPYILSMCGKDPVTPLGVAWVTEIVAVISGYMLKAHFDKNKERENDRLDTIASVEHLNP